MNKVQSWGAETDKYIRKYIFFLKGKQTKKKNRREGGKQDEEVED